MAELGTQAIITEEITTLTVGGADADAITVSLSGDETELSVNNFALPAQVAAAQIGFAQYGQIAGPSMLEAVRQLADLAMYRQAATPVAGLGGASLSEGNLWYDTANNQLKVYRETSTGVFEFVPIIVGNISPDSDTLDAGAF